MSRESTDRLMWVARMMPDECALALTRFVRVNPTYNGARWEDVLDVLLDTDSHLEVTEYIYEALDGAERCSEVAVTLLWAYGGIPTPDEVRTVLQRCCDHPGREAGFHTFDCPEGQFPDRANTRSPYHPSR